MLLLVQRSCLLLTTGLLLFIAPAYGSNKALLVGVSVYEHEDFRQLRRVSAALKSLESALKTYGFDVEILENPEHNTFRSKLEQFVRLRVDHSILFLTGLGYDEMHRNRAELSHIFFTDSDPPTKDNASGHMKLDALVEMLVGYERTANMWVFLDGLDGEKTIQNRVDMDDCGADRKASVPDPLNTVPTLTVATLDRDYKDESGDALASKLIAALERTKDGQQLCEIEFLQQIESDSERDPQVGRKFSYWRQCREMCLRSTVGLDGMQDGQLTGRLR